MLSHASGGDGTLPTFKGGQRSRHRAAVRVWRHVGLRPVGLRHFLLAHRSMHRLVYHALDLRISFRSDGDYVLGATARAMSFSDVAELGAAGADVLAFWAGIAQ